jgi:hypothetical protein
MRCIEFNVSATVRALKNFDRIGVYRCKKRPRAIRCLAGFLLNEISEAVGAWILGILRVIIRNWPENADVGLTGYRAFTAEFRNNGAVCNQKMEFLKKGRGPFEFSDVFIAFSARVACEKDNETVFVVEKRTGNVHRGELDQGARGTMKEKKDGRHVLQKKLIEGMR